MNYQAIYIRLISTKTKRIGYVEKHHILPRCLGGTDDKENIVELYPEEHYLAHLLLCKIYPKNQKLLYAAMNMTTGSMINNGKRTNKAYGWLRRQYAESMSGDNNPNRKNPELQKLAALKRTGQKRTEETKTKMSMSQKGRTFTDDTKLKMAESAKNRPPISEVTREKLKKRVPNSPWTGKKMSEETKEKMKIAARNREENKRKQKELA